MQSCSVSARIVQEKHKCSRGDHLPSPSRVCARRVLQGTGGGEHPRQLCGHLRAHGRDDGLWISTDNREQDSPGVRSRLFLLSFPLIFSPSDTSLKSRTNLRSRPVRQWQSRMRFRGEQRASDTARTKSFSMSLKASTCSYANPKHSLLPLTMFFRSTQKEPSSAQKFSVPLK